MSTIFMHRYNDGINQSQSSHEAPPTSVLILEDDNSGDGGEPLGRDSTQRNEKTMNGVRSPKYVLVSARNRAAKLKVGKLLRHLSQVYDRFGIRHVIPIAMLVAYSVLGAAIMQAVERPCERDQLQVRQQRVKATRDEAAQRLASILTSSMYDRDTKIRMSRRLILWYEESLGATPPRAEEIAWDMWGALFYVGTIYTTIGYGNITTKTTAGKILSILYALIGIPLALTVLNDLGKLLDKWISNIWIQIQTARRRFRYATPGTDDNDINALPIWLALAMTFVWMLFCAGLFCIWEEWSYFTSFYFFFVSLSTIGLGDVLPSHPKLLVLNFGLVIVGLSLVSMTINVIEKNIERFIFRMKKIMVEQYLASATAAGPCDKQQLMKRCWSTQPWLLRAVMPRLLTDARVAQLNQSASNTVRDVRKVAKELGITTVPADLPEKRIPPPTVQNGFIRTEGVADPKTHGKRNGRMQIMDACFEEESQVQAEPTPTPLQVMVPPAVQVPVPPPAPTPAPALAPAPVLNTVTFDRAAERSSAVSSAQTVHTLCSTAAQTCADTCELSIQTECSYLKKAKQLNELTTRRTDSLEVVAVSITRPGKKPRKSLHR